MIRTKHFGALTALVAAMAASLLLLLLLGPVFPARAQSAIVVNTAADEQNANGKCSLREAITNANNDDQSGSADCPAGGGANTITFALAPSSTI